MTQTIINYAFKNFGMKTLKNFYLILLLFSASAFAQFPMAVQRPVENRKVEAGKPQLFLLHIGSYSVNCVGTEEEEIRKNFENKVLVFTLCKPTKLEFPKENITVNDGKRGMLFWSGKESDPVISSNGRSIFATEFVSKQLGQNKESSYSINTRKWKQKIAELTNSNVPTNESKIVSEAFLRNQVIKAIGVDDRIPFNAILSKWDYSKVKTIEVSYTNDKGVKKIFSRASFNPKGLPISIFREDSSQEFTYVGSLLKAIKEEARTTTFSYHADKMISVRNDEKYKRVAVYWLESGHLLKDFYGINEDDEMQPGNYHITMFLKNNCIVMQEKYTEITCETPKDKKPYQVTTKMLSNGRELNVMTTFKEENNNTINIYRFIDEKSDPLVGKILLNEKNFIDKYIVYEGGKSLTFDYYYEFYP